MELAGEVDAGWKEDGGAFFCGGIDGGLQSCGVVVVTVALCAEGVGIEELVVGRNLLGAERSRGEESGGSAEKGGFG